MKREEVQKCLKTIDTAFRNCYKDYSNEDMRLLIDVWMAQFANCDGTEVMKAVMQYISTGRYAPTIADIKDILLNRGEQYSDEEVWELVKKAGRNGLYTSEEEWAKLPEQVRKAIRPNTIMEIARSDNESLGYIKKDVLNAYHSVQNKDRTNNAVLFSDRRLKLECEHLMLGE